MKDRYLSALLLILIGLLGVVGYRIDPPPFSDPLGPRFLPLLVITILLPLTLWESIKVKKPKPVESVHVLRLLSICFLYLLTWPVLGYLAATTLSLYLAARQFHCSWMQALMVALIVSVLSYGIFHFLLDISLPLGNIYLFAGG